MKAIYLFILFGVAGWMIELFFTSLEMRKINFALDKVWHTPFLPIYGFGGIYLMAIQPVFQSLPLLARGLMYGISMTALEFTAGIICELIWKRKLWDYTSNSRFNIYGYVDAEHFLYWTALGLVFEQFVFPMSLKLLTQLHLA